MVAVMLLTNEMGEKQIYFFNNKSFDSFDECRRFVQNNLPLLHYKLYTEYGHQPVEMISCVPTEVVDRLTGRHGTDI